MLCFGDAQDIDLNYFSPGWLNVRLTATGATGWAHSSVMRNQTHVSSADAFLYGPMAGPSSLPEARPIASQDPASSAFVGSCLAWAPADRFLPPFLEDSPGVPSAALATARTWTFMTKGA